MKELATLLGSPLFQRIGWALLAFLWQGTLVAALLACAGVALRRRKASLRYAVGCGALALMLAMPVATFLTQRAPQGDGPGASGVQGAAAPAVAPPASAVFSKPSGPQHSTAGSFASTVRRSAASLEPFLVAGWLLGVLLLSLRFLAGWTAAWSLVRRDVFPAPDALLATLARLCESLRVSRPVRLMQSAALAVPTALGAVRPVILLPVCAAAGLSPEAVEALLAHELAHIRRHDYLVNLLQTAVETLLFYHPAVWWVSRWIRAERENCCDDLAVLATGDPRAYARALVGLEETRGFAFELSVAANGGSLWRRVARLLPVPPPPADRASGWLAGVLALAMLGTLGAAARISAFAEASADRSSFATASEAMPSPAGARPAARPSEPAAAKPAQQPGPARRPAGQPDSRISAARVAGGVAGGMPGGVAGGVAGAVTGGVRGGVEGGVPGGIDGGVASDAVDDPARMTSLIGRQSLDTLVSLRIHGVTPEFVGRFHAAGYPRISADSLLSLRIHGVDPDTAGEWEKLGFGKPGLDAIVSARIHGVTPEFARAMKALGLEADLDTLVSLRIHGVTPDFVGAFRALGYKNLSADEAVSCRIHGVTPDFAKEIRSLGYVSPSLDELTALRIHGATPDFIRKANGSAGARLSIDELVEWRIQGRNLR